jgi:hypothetical protein
MRAIIFLTLIALFCLPVIANQEDEEVLPFAYVTERNGFYDLHLMDAHSGTMLYELSSEIHDCGRIVSKEDGIWLLQSQSSNNTNIPSDYKLIELETSREWYLGYGFIRFLGFSEDMRKFAFLNMDEGLLHFYDLDAEELDRNISETNQINTAQFFGNELVYVTRDRESVFLNRWDGTNFQETSFDSIPSSGFDVSFHENYLRMVFYRHEELSLIALVDMNTSERTDYEIELTDFPDWLPDSLSQFAYIDVENSIWVYDLESGDREFLVEVPDDYNHSPYISWSPYGQYLAIYQEHAGGTFLESIELNLLNLETNSLSYVMDSYSFNWGMRWLSATELVYSYVSRQSGGEFDIFYEDLVTGASTNLTNSPEVNELFDCAIG